MLLEDFNTHTQTDKLTHTHLNHKTTLPLNMSIISCRLCVCVITLLIWGFYRKCANDPN